MLTADLVRATVRSDRVYPRYVDASNPRVQEAACRMVALFGDHVGERMGTVEEAIADLIGDSPDFMLQRGLVKLLKDRSCVEIQAPRSPVEIREAVFRHAMDHWPVADGREDSTDRREVLKAAAKTLGMSLEEVDAFMYADLKEEERLVSVDLPEPQALVARYNLALAQAVLLRAREVVVTLPSVKAARARQLMRVLKFHRLMHRARRIDGGYELVIDGPLSMFRQTQRYGLQLALFLPALCHCDTWSLAAEVTWGEPRRACTFQLDQRQGLVSHTREKGTWRSEEERHFEASWKKRKSPWKLRRAARLVDLDGRGVLVPDYVLTHADGRQAYLDIVWFWRKRAFKRRLALLAEAGPSNLIVAIATRLNGDETTDLEGLDPERVVPFKGVIQPKKIEALAERLACP